MDLSNLLLNILEQNDPNIRWYKRKLQTLLYITLLVFIHCFVMQKYVLNEVFQNNFLVEIESAIRFIVFIIMVFVMWE